MSFFSTCWCPHCMLSVQLACIVVRVRPCPSSLYFFCISGPEIGWEALIMRSCIDFPLVSAIQSSNTHKGGPGALKTYKKMFAWPRIGSCFPRSQVPRHTDMTGQYLLHSPGQNNCALLPYWVCSKTGLYSQLPERNTPLALIALWSARGLLHQLTKSSVLWFSLKPAQDTQTADEK